MIEYKPLASWTGPTIPLEQPFAHLDRIEWLPLNDSELLLAAHYMPLAIRLDRPAPMIGALVRADMLARELVAPPGRWTGGYSPLSLRCFPFRLAPRKLTADPIADLEVAQVPAARGSNPKLLQIKDDAGAPSSDLKAIYDGLTTVLGGQLRLQTAMDLLLAAEFLVPIAMPDGDTRAARYFTIDRRRFAAASNQSLAAMSRNNFTVIELATVLNFSQVHLRANLRPAAVPPPAASGEAAAAPAETSGHSGLETIQPWLDTSELFPGAWAADPSIWRAIADPAATVNPTSAPAAPPPSG